MSESHLPVEAGANSLLITDGELIPARLIEYFSAILGISIKIVVDPVNISSILKNEKFDVVLLDLSIPNIEPFSLINNHNSKMIIVYDNSTLGVAIEVLSKGSFSLLKKPYSLTQFLRTLREDNVISYKDEESIIELDTSKFFSSRDNLMTQDQGHVEPVADKTLKTEPIKAESCRTVKREDYLDKYHFMVENSQDVIYTIDELGIFTFVNSRLETLLGFSKADLIGKHFLVLVHHEDIEEANTYLYGDNDMDIGQENIELRFKSRKGNCEPILFDIRTTIIPKQTAGNEKYKFADEDGACIPAGRCCMARDITERRKIEDIIHHSAHHDYLTGLPDKVLLNDRIDSAIAQSKRSSTNFALMFLDLDGFKEVNDTYGHSMGDALLQAVGARIKGCIREVDTLARVGGDEFMLLISQIDDYEGVKKIAEKVICEIQKPYSLTGSELTLSASIGIAMHPDDGDSKDVLISNADMSMYHIKRNNKNGFQFFSKMQ